MYTYQLAVISVGNCKYSTGNYYFVIIMTSKLNLIKIRLINLDFGKRLKILRVFADVYPNHPLTIRCPAILHFLALNIEPWPPSVSPNRASSHSVDNDTVSLFLTESIADIDCNITTLQKSLSLYP